jgi:hypothetical protein
MMISVMGKERSGGSGEARHLGSRSWPMSTIGGCRIDPAQGTPR